MFMLLLLVVHISQFVSHSVALFQIKLCLRNQSLGGMVSHSKSRLWKYIPLGNVTKLMEALLDQYDSTKKKHEATFGKRQ